MDTKKVIQQLIKIADSQQKIINKLAQGLQVDPPVLQGNQKDPGQATPPPTTNLKPNAPQKQTPEGQLIMNALPPAVAPNVTSVTVSEGKVNVTFMPGQKTQANYDAVKAIVQQLQSGGTLTGRSYQVHAV